jgi:anti-anti-sigma regulatory factor
MDTLLNGVATSRASTVILDITGVAIVDTQIADAFICASQAVSLLGAQVVLTSLRSEVAQTLVQLGVDLRTIITRSTLRVRATGHACVRSTAPQRPWVVSMGASLSCDARTLPHAVRFITDTR